jgi:hypothetical protein
MEKKISHPQLIQTPEHSVHSLVAVPTMLPQLLGKNMYGCQKQECTMQIKRMYETKSTFWTHSSL